MQVNHERMKAKMHAIQKKVEAKSTSICLSLKEPFTIADKVFWHVTHQTQIIHEYFNTHIQGTRHYIQEVKVPGQFEGAH